MAFRRKWQYLLPYQPDIMVIQECEHESKYKPSEIIPDYNEFLWFGDNVNKGVGILSFHDYHIKVSDDYDESYRYVIPLILTQQDRSINLFAIWAMPDKVKANSYVGQIWNALDHYQSLLKSPSILIGDWNSNQIWDTERKNGNHTMCVDLLAEQNILSLYHHQFDELHGFESTPTIYLLKQKHKPYHLDYCFLQKEMIDSSTHLEVGQPDEWLSRSDHMPLIINDLNL